MAKRGTYNHPKTRRLARLLHIPRSYAYGLVTAMWDYAEEHCKYGDIGKCADFEIEEEVDWNGDEGAFVAACITAQWLDEDATHRLLIHDWPDHCEDTVHNRIARERGFFANGEAPKTSRLSLQERSVAEAFYNANPGKTQESRNTHEEPEPCARTNNDHAHESPEQAQENARRAFKSAQIAKKKHSRAPIPEPVPVPIPEPKPVIAEELVETTTGESPSIAELAKNRLDELAGKLTGEKPDKPIGRAPLPPPSDLNSNGRTVEEIARIREEIASRKSVRDPAEEAVHG